MSIPQSLGGALGLGLQQGTQTGLQGLMQNYLKQQKLEEQEIKDIKEQKRAQGTAQLYKDIQEGKEVDFNNLPEGVTAQDITQLARAQAEENKAKARSGEQKITREFKTIDDYSKKMIEQTQNLPIKEASLAEMKNAIESGEVGRFSLSALADITGIEQFLSPKGAAFKAASKEFFLANVSRVKARGVNQFMEKTLFDQLPKIGRSEKANLTIEAILNNELDIQKKESEIFNEKMELANQGVINPLKIPSEVSKEVQEFAKENSLATMKKIKKIADSKSEISSGKRMVIIVAPDGSEKKVPYTPEIIKKAIQLGGRIKRG